MAADYDPTQPTAKDRVRAMIADRAATFRFQNEEIVAELSRHSGDEAGAIETAIVLLESDFVKIGSSKTIKQGSVSRTETGLSTQGIEGLLSTLRARLRTLRGQSAGDYGGPVVVDGFAQENAWNGCGFLTR